MSSKRVARGMGMRAGEGSGEYSIMTQALPRKGMLERAPIASRAEMYETR